MTSGSSWCWSRRSRSAASATSRRRWTSLRWPGSTRPSPRACEPRTSCRRRPRSTASWSSGPASSTRARWRPTSTGWPRRCGGTATSWPVAEPAPALATVDTTAGFAALAAGWDELVEASPRPSPFLLHGWLAAWWKHYGEGCRLAVVTARRGERLVGVLPLYVSRQGPVRVARFLGAHESALG